GAPERDRHVLRHGSGDEQHIGVAWACDKADAGALDVVVRIGERVDFQLATVAGAGVNLADRQRAAERAKDFFLRARDDDVLTGRRWHGFGLDAGDCDLAEHGEHSDARYSAWT